VELCLLCFSGGFEDSSHSRRHRYTLIGGELLRTMGSSEASVSSCLSLLENSRRYSVGSWHDMNSRVNLGSPQECESIFMKLYSQWESESKSAYPCQSFTMDDRALVGATQVDRTGMFVDTLVIPESSDIPGFLRHRVDFDIEFDDSAELIIADLELNDSDTPEDLSIKMGCLKTYTERTRAREDAKRFVVHNRLLNYQEQANSHRSRTVEQSDVRGKLRPLQRFFASVDGFEEFTLMCLYEQRILSRIRDLCESKGDTDNLAIHSGKSVVAKEDPDDNRPATRSRSGQEVKRGMRAVDEECNKIREILGDPSVRTKIQETLEQHEIDALAQIGLSAELFAVIRNSLLKRSQQGARYAHEISVRRNGQIFSFDTTN
jgi:hypothetical protein